MDKSPGLGKKRRKRSQTENENIYRPSKIKDVLTLKDPEDNNSIISDLNWSYSIPYIVSASYVKAEPKEDNFLEYPGRVLQWNTNFDLRPEFTCLAKS